MRALYILLITILVPIFCQAQMVTIKEKNSFYLGHRFAASLKIQTQLALEPMNKGIENNRSFFINYNPKLELTAALSNKWSVKVVGTRHRVADQYGINTYDEEYYDTRSGNYLQLGGYANYRGTSAGIKMVKHFSRKAALAPVGTHFGFGISRTWVRGSFENAYASRQGNGWGSPPVTIPIATNAEHNFKFISINLEYIQREMISKKMFIDVGFEMNGNLTPRVGEFENTNSTGFNSNDQLAEIDQSLRERYFLFGLFNLDLGVGYVF